MALDTGERTAKLQGGEEVRFEKALIATGAMVRILRLDGAQLDGIHYLRAFGNADAIRADAERAEKVVLIGGSYIGCEVAATLTARGKQCTIVMMEPTTVERGFGREAGRWVHERLQERGVEMVTEEEVDRFRGEDRVEAVVTKGGREIEGDMVVIGAGVRPDVMLAQRAGLEVGDGIVCDERLRTSAEGIFAAGDCCSYESVLHGERRRIEHWDVALQQGRHAADAMLGDESPYDVVPYFFSDLSDWASLHSVGPPRNWDETIWRGSPDGDEWLLWYLRDGRVEGALTCGRQMDLIDARRLIAEKRDVSDRRAELSDTESDLAAID
jgi:3-phenylpropionate/trans-cinnamate dioxygenase ferredoxin reductase subunit